MISASPPPTPNPIHPTLTSPLVQERGTKIDLLIICGDFQAIRNESDLETMAVPLKHRHIGSFWKYYSGHVRPPVPTLFIGGNHEAANHLWELYYGGFAAPDIYYMGAAGVVKVPYCG